MEHETLASELLKELKASARRWFIAFCIMCVLELITIAAFIQFIALPIEEVSYIQESDLDNNSRSTQIINGDNNGTSETDGTQD